MMKANDFVKQATYIATSVQTIYALGTVGQPMTEYLIEDICNRNDAYVNYFNNERRTMYLNNIGKYAFDCIGLIKAILWNWTVDKINYNINNVPDIDADSTISKCTIITELKPGAIVWMPGHIGIVKDKNSIIECTSAFSNGVCITKPSDRNWQKIGLLPWIDYTTDTTHDEIPTWAIEAVKWAKNGNITDGTNLNSYATRAEVVTMLYRYSKGRTK